MRRGVLKFLYCFLFLPLYPLALGSDSVEISIRRNDGTVSYEINKKPPNSEHWIPIPPPTPTPQLTTQLHTSTADCSTPLHSRLPIVTKERTLSLDEYWQAPAALRERYEFDIRRLPNFEDNLSRFSWRQIYIYCRRVWEETNNSRDYFTLPKIFVTIVKNMLHINNTNLPPFFRSVPATNRDINTENIFFSKYP